MFFTRLSENLTNSKLIPWRFRYLGGPINTMIGVHLRRIKLTKKIKNELDGLPDDITIMIAVKGRLGYRLINNLKSIREQSYPQSLIKIIIVDYDNSEEDSSWLREISKKYDVNLISVSNKPVWNKSHCFNVAIRSVDTKYVMANDADMIISQNYISEAIKKLKKNPLGLILNVMLDLPQDVEKYLIDCSQENREIDLNYLKNCASIRRTYTQINEDEEVHIAIFVTFAFFLKMIHGYDEFYKYWGSEDNDMYRRLCYFGLKTVDISDTAFYMHQWHEKYEGVQHEGLREIIKRNSEYFYNNHSIIRNGNKWGEV